MKWHKNLFLQVSADIKFEVNFSFTLLTKNFYSKLWIEFYLVQLQLTIKSVNLNSILNNESMFLEPNFQRISRKT